MLQNLFPVPCCHPRTNHPQRQDRHPPHMIVLEGSIHRDHEGLPSPVPPPQILQLERTKISPTACMNVPFAPTRSLQDQEYGPVTHVGLCFISVASRLGPRTKGLQSSSGTQKKPITRLPNSGDAPVAIFLKTYCLPPILVGAKRK